MWYTRRRPWREALSESSKRRRLSAKEKLRILEETPQPGVQIAELCRRELVVERTEVDDEALVGDECHIVSGRAQGPRYTRDFPAERLDSPDNLILLCRTHHKLVDDQHETYTAQLLQQMRTNHEKWVATCLSEEESQVPAVRLRRFKENIPTHLVRLVAGRDVLAVVEGACASELGHDELETEEEVALVGGFCRRPGTGAT